MPRLIVRDIEASVVSKLKERAHQNGLSVQEQHRRILREALLGAKNEQISFREYLLRMPDIGDDSLFSR